MNVSLEVKLSNEPLVVVQIEERLYGFKNRHAAKSGVKRFPPPSLSTFEHPQAAQLVVTKHAQSFRCDSSHSFVAGRKVSHFEECTISLHLNPKEKNSCEGNHRPKFTHSSNCLPKSAYSG